MSSYAITGASRGIGFEFVRQLSSSRDNIVFALVRNKTTAKNLQHLQADRPNVHILEADITDVAALKIAAQEVSKITGGKLDVLINNAALMHHIVVKERSTLLLDTYPEGKEQLLEEDLNASFHVNVIGPIHTINVFLPLLRAGSAKKVITLSTGLADLDFTLVSEFPFAAPYSISKAALNMAIAKYAVEYKEQGFVFLSISPGLVDTSTAPPTAEEIEQYKGMIAKFQKVDPRLKGPITPDDSVGRMLSVIEKATVKETGAFISQNGNRDWL